LIWSKRRTDLINDRSAQIETVRWFSFRRLQVGRGSVSTNCTCFLASRSRRLARGNRDWKCLRALRAPRVSEPSHSADKKRSDRRNRAPRRRFRPAAPESARHALLQAPRFVQLGDRPMRDKSAKVVAHHQRTRSRFVFLAHAHRWRPAVLAAGSAFQRGLELPNRRVARPADGVEWQARPCHAAIAFDSSQPAVEALTDRGRRLGRPSPPSSRSIPRP